jgi:predicted nucleic acid-binding protein
VRAVVDESVAAREWTRAIERRTIRASAPDLIYAEVGHAVLRYVRSGRLEAGDAAEIVAAVLSLPLRVAPLGALVRATLALAIERELSVYDACYVALAEAAGATLVTADRRLAGAYNRVELVV